MYNLQLLCNLHHTSNVQFAATLQFASWHPYPLLYPHTNNTLFLLLVTLSLTGLSPPCSWRLAEAARRLLMAARRGHTPLAHGGSPRPHAGVLGQKPDMDSTHTLLPTQNRVGCKLKAGAADGNNRRVLIDVTNCGAKNWRWSSSSIPQSLFFDFTIDSTGDQLQSVNGGRRGGAYPIGGGGGRGSCLMP